MSSLCIIFLEKNALLVKSSSLRGWAKNGWRKPSLKRKLVGAGR
jgi:hypothetical protein